MDEKSEPTQPTPYPAPTASEDVGDFTDAPADDPGATVRFAGCHMEMELERELVSEAVK